MADVADLEAAVPRAAPTTDDRSASLAETSSLLASSSLLGPWPGGRSLSSTSSSAGTAGQADVVRDERAAGSSGPVHASYGSVNTAGARAGADEDEASEGGSDRSGADDEEEPLLRPNPLAALDVPWLRDVVATALFVQSIAWLTMAGFGPPWALFSIFDEFSETYLAESLEGFLQSPAFFYTATITSFVVAFGRTFVILKITLDRERQQTQTLPGGAKPEVISHTEYWWANRFGLALSCVFELGDGMGRVWAIASVLDEFVKLYVDEYGLFFNVVYLNTCLIVATISGVFRALWWIWYWAKFSEIPVQRRETVNEDKVEEDVIQEQVRSRKSRKERKQPKTGSLRKCLYMPLVYPLTMSLIPSSLRRSFKLVYCFMDGFGRTWAFFAVINAVIEYSELTVGGENSLFDVAIYVWVAFSLAFIGGLYVVSEGTYRRFKVFLH